MNEHHDPYTPDSDPLSDPLTDHEYDGIREYDNPTPGWWNWLFVGAIVFSVLYFMAYQLGTAGTSVAEAYEKQEREFKARLIAALGDVQVNEQNILAFLKGSKKEFLPVGAGIFQAKCASCHGANAQGLSGPNMTDDYYKNIKTLGDIGRVVLNGVPGTAMAGWDGRMEPTEIVVVAAYVASLRGTNVPGLGPEGEQPPPWPDAPREIPPEKVDATQ